MWDNGHECERQKERTVLGREQGCRPISLLSIIQLKTGIHRQASLPFPESSWTDGTGAHYYLAFLVV